MLQWRNNHIKNVLKTENIYYLSHLFKPSQVRTYNRQIK